MSNKKAYLVLTHTFAPAPGADTSMKDFGAEGQWQMHESVYFVTRIRKSWWQTATTIVNLSESKVEKNKAETLQNLLRKNHCLSSSMIGQVYNHSDVSIYIN